MPVLLYPSTKLPQPSVGTLCLCTQYFHDSSCRPKCKEANTSQQRKELFSLLVQNDISRRNGSSVRKAQPLWPWGHERRVAMMRSQRRLLEIVRATQTRRQGPVVPMLPPGSK
jgi:hypothetical protein